MKTRLTFAFFLATSALISSCQAPTPQSGEGVETDAGRASDSSNPPPETNHPGDDLWVNQVTVCAKTAHCEAVAGKLQLKISAQGTSSMRGCENNVYFDDLRIVGLAPRNDQFGCMETQSVLDYQTQRYREIRLPANPPVAGPDPRAHRFDWNGDFAVKGDESCITVSLTDLRNAIYPAQNEKELSSCADYAQAQALPPDPASVAARCHRVVEARYIYEVRQLDFEGLTLTMGGKKIEATLDQIDLTQSLANVTFDCQNPKPATSARLRLEELTLRESVRQLAKPARSRSAAD